ncbi:MAG TPA: ImmA/IrrE family metallo-endopeptidase [Candidatus Dormibacteraeota bacterium]
MRPIVVLGSDEHDTACSSFDAAYELGHLVLHHDAEPGRQAVEQQAHRFASAFLLPAETIRWRPSPSACSKWGRT